ncbi:hypothetical protein BBJ28_00007998 [Nothophytophthora sp. Chile5]|nr:hypothetical protein BBJ28_00007998 [Nothophytophthora sp. Chile5]
MPAVNQRRTRSTNFKQRNEELEQHLREQQRAFQQERAQLKQDARDAQQTQQSLEAVLKLAIQRQRAQLSAFEQERAQLQQKIANDSRLAQNQQAQLRFSVTHLTLHLHEQARDFEDEREQLQQQARTTRSGQDRAISTIQRRNEELTRRLREQERSFKEERTRFQQQANDAELAQTRRDAKVSQLRQHLSNLQTIMDGFRGQTAAHTRVVHPQQEGVDLLARDQRVEELTQRLLDQQSAFEQERAQLLDQASESHVTRRNTWRQALADRETILTCPIAFDLFEEPVTTECCGKTFSEEALLEAGERDTRCPFCRAHAFRTHPTRDIAKLVELHRSERAALDANGDTTRLVELHPSERVVVGVERGINQPPPVPSVVVDNAGARQTRNVANHRIQRGRRRNARSNAHRGRRRGNRGQGVGYQQAAFPPEDWRIYQESSSSD